MVRFSERMGFVEVRDSIQIDSLDTGTRVDLWNIVYPYVRTNAMYYPEYEWSQRRLARLLWTELMRFPLDEIDQTMSDRFTAFLKSWILQDEFHHALDVVEFLARYAKVVDHSDTLRDKFNAVFERNLVGYRIVGSDILPVTDAVEIDSIEGALDSPGINAGARAHLRNALAMLSDRANPDYANSIKESISAVESCLRERTGKTTLSAALKDIDRRGKELHPALSEGWQKIYAYTSDSDGIRHGSITASEATEALATYFLVTCSSFMNYVTKAYNN